MRFFALLLAVASGLAPAPASPSLRALFQDTQRVARETGLRPAIARTLQSQRAIAETVLELASELPKPPPLTSVFEAFRIAAQTSAGPKGSTAALTDLAQAALAWGSANVAPDLAPKFLRKLCERCVWCAVIRDCHHDCHGHDRRETLIDSLARALESGASNASDQAA
jgi:hypothetical protein